MLNQIANTHIAALPSYTKIPLHQSHECGSTEISLGNDPLSRAKILSDDPSMNRVQRAMEQAI